jgi:hypothetical protein
MSTNFFRYRYGDARCIKAPWKTAFGINIGDLVYTDPADSVTTPDGYALFPTKPAGSFTFSTAIADPTTAPTVADSGGVVLGAGFSGGTYKAAYTIVTADGAESGPSSISAGTTITATHGINLTIGAALPAGVVAVNWYLSAAGGSTVFFVVQTLNGQGVTLTGPGPGTLAPPAANGLSALVLSQIAFAKQFVGTSAQFYDGNALTALTPYGVKDGYVRIDTEGTFDFPLLAAASFNDGDFFGVGTITGTSLDPQTIAPVKYKAQAIARVVQGGTLLTTVRLRMYGNKLQLSQVNF